MITRVVCVDNIVFAEEMQPTIVEYHINWTENPSVCIKENYILDDAFHTNHPCFIRAQRNTAYHEELLHDTMIYCDCVSIEVVQYY